MFIRDALNDIAQYNRVTIDSTSITICIKNNSQIAIVRDPIELLHIVKNTNNSYTVKSHTEAGVIKNTAIFDESEFCGLLQFVARII